MSTMLHELGHAVYDENIDPALPYSLRQPAHSFTTEAVAIFFERLSKNPIWMQKMLALSDKESTTIQTATREALHNEKLIFSRWSQVMLRFEKALYENPEQDLNQLWWNLVEEYQLIQKPEGRNEPDWATKIHVAIYPVYYYNYQLGGILAAQYLQAITAELGLANFQEVDFCNNYQMGQFMIEKIFRPGKKYRWDEFIRRATGENLSSKYFVEQL
jgi:peptidyl-dipeptidase A